MSEKKPESFNEHFLCFLGLTFWIFAPLSVTQPLIIVFTWQQRGKRGVGSCFAARRKKRQLGGFFSSASISSLLLRQRTASFLVCYEIWSVVEAVLRFQTTSRCLQDRESTSGTSPQTPGRGMSKNSSRLAKKFSWNVFWGKALKTACFFLLRIMLIMAPL